MGILLQDVPMMEAVEARVAPAIARLNAAYRRVQKAEAELREAQADHATASEEYKRWAPLFTAARDVCLENVERIHRRDHS